MLPGGRRAQVPATPLERLFLFNSPGLFIGDQGTLALGTRRVCLCVAQQKSRNIKRAARCSILRPSIEPLFLEWWRSRLKAHYLARCWPEIWSAAAFFNVFDANYCATTPAECCLSWRWRGEISGAQYQQSFLSPCVSRRLNITASFVRGNIWRCETDVKGNAENLP